MSHGTFSTWKNVKKYKENVKKVESGQDIK